ncbi:MAG: dienelactone hydrolase family protein [Mangrovibacterium sp.]
MKHLALILLLNIVLIAQTAGEMSELPSAKHGSEKKDTCVTYLNRFFSPPALFAGQYGEFRSPLKFYSGKEVKTPKEWAARRKEILNRWHEMMGQWPPLITGQQPEYLDSVRRENFTQYHISFYWTPDEKTDGYLLVPDGEGLKPAVITVFYEPETAIGVGGKPFRDFADQLAKRGFVTLSIGTREASARQEFSLYYPNIEHAQVQPLSMLAYAAANAWQVLAHIPGVDSTRIGIAGHSFGGKWAMFASCLYEKFACAVWSDPGIVMEESRPSVNYWEPLVSRISSETMEETRINYKRQSGPWLISNVEGRRI